MKRWWMLVVSAGVVCAALGCVPRKVFWSPDGQHGAVVGEDTNLYLCNPAGNLSKPIVSGVGQVAWFPDSKRFIATRNEQAATWEQAQVVFSEERKKALLAKADQLRAEILAYDGKWDDFKPTTGQGLTPGEFVALALYVRDHRNQGLAEKLGDEWAKTKEMKAELCRLQVYEVSDGAATAGKTLCLLPDAVSDIRISPTGTAVALTTPVPSDASFPLSRLQLLSTQAEERPLVVAEQVCASSDFSPDGKYLYYGTTKAPLRSDKDDFTLGTLTRRRVADDAGNLMAAPSEPEDLVGLMFWSTMKVRCLRDGRVLFTSCEVSLPTTAAEMPKQVSLFAVDPSRQPTVTRVLPREVGAGLDGLGTGDFEVSPDDKRVVVTVSLKGVAVLTLATGKVETVVSAENAQNLPNMPVWRTADELAIAVPPKNQWGSPERSELVLYSLDGKTRCISRQWPEILAKPKVPETQPAK